MGKERGLDCGFKLSTKALKCGEKFLGNFSTPRVLSEFVSKWTDISNRRQQKNYVKNPKRKNHMEIERIHYRSEDYNEFSRVICDYQF